jgi:hypothetical protein
MSNSNDLLKSKITTVDEYADMIFDEFISEQMPDGSRRYLQHLDIFKKRIAEIYYCEVFYDNKACKIVAVTVAIQNTQEETLKNLDEYAESCPEILDYDIDEFTADGIMKIVVTTFDMQDLINAFKQEQEEIAKYLLEQEQKDTGDLSVLII